VYLEKGCKKKSWTITKKIYLNINSLNSFFYSRLNTKLLKEDILEEDFLNIYNYKNINKREIEDPLFHEENEKFYYSYLKIFFLKENFYDTFIKDYYIRFLSYENFILNLKKKVLLKKKNKKL